MNFKPLNLKETDPDDWQLKSQGNGMGSSLSVVLFDFERKQAFLTLLDKLWPHVYKVCDQIGINPQTYYNHLKSDPDFAAKVHEAKQRRLERIEAVAVDNAEDKAKGFLDRAMILRAYKPERYDRAKKIIVEGYKMVDTERTARLGAVETVIDAEVTSSYLERKQRQQERRQAQLEAEGKTGGEQKGGRE